MKSLDVLQRLAKQAVDRERQALQAIGSEIMAVEAMIEAKFQALEREAAASLDFMTSGATLNAYLLAEKDQIQAQKRRLIELQEAYAVQIEQVRRERVEQKRLELLIERRAKQATLEAAAREQKTIDELVNISGRKN